MKHRYLFNSKLADDIASYIVIGLFGLLFMGGGYCWVVIMTLL